MSDNPNDLRRSDTRTVTSSRKLLPAGTTLAGRYRITEVLGAGGMGIVYSAHDKSLDVGVALKVLADKLAGDSEALERFRREIRLARQVSHPNVVRIHDIGADGELLFMTMDLVPGQTLVHRLADGPLPAEIAVGIAIQLAEALTEAHRHGIVHRDIKPSNILVDDHGKAWLTDFGVARAVHQQQLTEAGQSIGTLAYMAPEQIRGEDVDARADLYALGLTLWEMITGKTPLTGETQNETIARRINTATPARLPGEERVPTDIRRIVRRCLEPDPDDRYPDANALAEDLARGRAGLNWRRLLRRTGWAALVAGMMGAVALLLPKFMSHQAPTQEAAPSVVVLPVINGTGSEQFDWVRNSMAEITAGRLAENPNLTVVESLRVRRALADLRLTASELDGDRLARFGELLDADRIVRGTLLGNDPELRLQVSMVAPLDAGTTEFQIQLQSDAILAGADEVARRIITALQLPATSATMARLPMSDSSEALGAFDSGIEELARGNQQRAMQLLEQAVEHDQSFGLAWGHLADARAAAGFYNQALDAAERAAELLDGHGGRAEAWASARLSALSGDIERAIQQFGQLVEQYPGDSDARLTLTELLAGNGQLDEAIRVIREVTAASPNHPRAWFLLGKFAVMSGDPQRAAEDYFVKALVIQNRLGDTEGRAEVLNGLGIAHEHLGQLDAAIRYYGEAAELRSQAGDRRGHAASLSNMGRLHMIHGSYQPARDVINQALSIREEIDDLDGMARTYNELGVLEEEVGNYQAARAHYGNALRIHEQLGSSLVAAEARTSLAFIHMMLGEYDTAEAFVRNAIEEQTAAGNSMGLMAGLQISGELDIVRGRWDQAQASLLRALEIARTSGNPFGEATAHGSIGLLAAYQGRISAALDAFDTAIGLLEPLADRRGLAENHLRAAEMLASMGLREAAGSRWQQAHDIFSDQANLSQRARLLRIEAVLTMAQADPAAASMFDEALQLARSSGSEAVAMEIRISRLQHLGGTLADFEQLADNADRLGHRPMQIRALAALAEKALEAGDTEWALQIISRGLRPPLALESWAGNWRLYAIRERIASATGTERPDSSRSKSLLMELAGQLPPDLQAPFRDRHGL